MADSNNSTAGYRPAEELSSDMMRRYRGLLPHGSADRTEPLRAAIWRAMMEIENDGADAAYQTLQHAWETYK